MFYLANSSMSLTACGGSFHSDHDGRYSGCECCLHYFCQHSDLELQTNGDHLPSCLVGTHTYAKQ